MSIGPTELIIVCGVAFLLIIIPSAIVYLLVIRSQGSTRNKRIPCPYCAELILPEAKVCRFCGRQVDNHQLTM